MSDPRVPSMPGWVRDALRAPVRSRPGSRERIMHAVRALPAPRRRSAPASAVRASRWFRRGSLTGAGGVLLTAALAFMVSVHRGDQVQLLSRYHGSALVLGDTVVPTVSARDSLGGRLLDTLRIVHFAMRGPHIGAAEVIGTFNGWQRGRTVLASTGHGGAPDEWAARVLVPRDALEFAFVVRDVGDLPGREHRIPAAPLPALD